MRPSSDRRAAHTRSARPPLDRALRRRQVVRRRCPRLDAFGCCGRAASRRRPDPLGAALALVPSSPVAVVMQAFRAPASPRDAPHGFGGLIPQVEGYRSLGILYPASLFPERAPEGFVLTTSFLGGALEPAWRRRRDDLLEVACGGRRAHLPPARAGRMLVDGALAGGDPPDSARPPPTLDRLEQDLPALDGMAAPRLQVTGACATVSPSASASRAVRPSETPSIRLPGLATRRRPEDAENGKREGRAVWRPARGLAAGALAALFTLSLSFAASSFPSLGIDRSPVPRARGGRGQARAFEAAAAARAAAGVVPPSVEGGTAASTSSRTTSRSRSTPP